MNQEQNPEEPKIDWKATLSASLALAAIGTVAAGSNPCIALGIVLVAGGYALRRFKFI